MTLRFDPQTGAVTSWKAAGITQDLVNAGDPTCRGLNDYLYVLGGDNSKVQYASGATLTVVDAGPLVASVRVDSSAPGCKSLSRLVQVVDGFDEVRITDSWTRRRSTRRGGASGLQLQRPRRHGPHGHALVGGPAQRGSNAPRQ